jgi:GNAT superfamily N-acetyltransferase
MDYGAVMNAPSIRPARPQDAGSLADLGRRTFIATFVEGFGIPYPKADLEAYLQSSFTPEVLARGLAEPGSAWWVAEEGGALVAFATAGPNTLPHPEAKASHAELRRLYVDEKAQGRGLGGRMLAMALHWMEAASAGPLWIGAWSGNLKAQRLYAAHGFEPVGTYQYPVGSWRDDEIIMRRG